MSDKQPPKTGFANDGYTKRPLQEGYVKKGGTNPSTSQIQTRPPAPAPMRPNNSQPVKK